MPKDITEASSIEELEALLHADDDESGDTTDTLAESDNSNDESPTTDESQETDQPVESNFDEYLLSLKPEDLLRKHPGLQGKFGALVDKQARERTANELANRQRMEQELRDQHEEDALLELIDEDPSTAARGFAERTLRKRSQNKNLKENQKVQEEYGAQLDAEMQAIYETPIMQEFANSMTDDQLVRLWWKNGRYTSFADWASGMLETVREYGREEGRREAAASAPPAERVASSTPASAARTPGGRQVPEFSSGLGDRVEENPGQYNPGDIRKMPFTNYAANRAQILKDIWGDE